MANERLKCTRCGKVYFSNQGSRYCDEDGTLLVNDSLSPQGNFEKEKFSKEGYRFFRRKKDDSIAKVLISAGVIVIFGGLILWAVESGLFQSHTGKFSSKRYKSVNDMLTACYGRDIPPIPASTSTRSEAAFQRMKEMARSVSQSAAGTVTISLDDENRAATAAVEAILSKEKLSTQTLYQQRVQGLTDQMKALTPRGSDLDYKAIILSGETVNAAMLPAGRMLVWERLMELLKQDPHLAGVIGHELAHAELKHHEPVLRFAKAGEKITSSLTGGFAGDAGQTLGAIAANLVSTVYDQDQEYEADRLGVCIAQLAGFQQKPNVSATAFGFLYSDSFQRANPEKEQKLPDGGTFRVLYDILRSHPEESQRTQYLHVLSQSLKSE